MMIRLLPMIAFLSASAVVADNRHSARVSVDSRYSDTPPPMPPSSLNWFESDCKSEIRHIPDHEDPYSALVSCSFLPDDFVVCESPKQLDGPPATTQSRAESESGCWRWGASRSSDLQWANVTCRALPCIECHGTRRFLRAVPCIKYTGHYFTSTLLFSLILGVFAVDRFSLSYSAVAVGKLMTLGGLGVWWLVDLVLLITGDLTPADGSNWMPYY